MSAPPAFGTYRVFHQTGSGVRGPVFRAFDSRQDRLVAIKAFTVDLAPSHVVRLADALRDLAAATWPATPSVVPVIDAGIEGTTPFAVMECQTGDTLDVAIRRLAPVPLEAAAPLLRQVAAAIDAAAAAGFHHGSLHPRDIFVTADGQDVRVTGFGIARAFARAEVPTPVRRSYAAPERHRGEVWGAGADLYSLGVIAHELLTGSRPATRGEQDGAFAASTPPEQRVQLRRLLAIALADRPEARYQSGASFAEAVSAVVRRERVAAPVTDALPGAQTAEAGPLAPAISDVGGAPSPIEPTPESATGTGDDAARHATHVDLMRPAGAAAASRLPGAPHASSDIFSLSRLAAVGLVAAACGSGIAYLTMAHRADVAGGSEARRGTTGTDVVLPREEAQTPATDAQPARAVPSRTSDAQVSVARASRLHIRSAPSGALVTVDGRLSGETPTTVRDLSPGTHVVRVARPGHVPREERVTLGVAAPVRTLMFALEPGLAAAAPAFGAIDVDSRPRGASVRVDGRLFGKAPLRVPRLRPGPHEVVVELGGYASVTRRVDVAAGVPLVMNVTLTSLVP